VKEGKKKQASIIPNNGWPWGVGGQETQAKGKKKRGEKEEHLLGGLPKGKGDQSFFFFFRRQGRKGGRVGLKKIVKKRAKVPATGKLGTLLPWQHKGGEKKGENRRQKPPARPRWWNCRGGSLRGGGKKGRKWNPK